MSRRSLDQLPEFVFGDFLAWSGDLTGSLRALFAEAPRGLRRLGQDRLMAYRNADLRSLAANPKVGNLPAAILTRGAFDRADVSRVGQGQQIARLIGNQVFVANGPLHAQSRQLLARHLMPKALPKFAPVAETAVAILIERLCGKPAFDFIHEFAERLTARFWAELLGLDEGEENRLVDLVTAMSPMFFFAKSDEETASADHAAKAYLETIDTAVQRTLRSAASDLLAEMQAEFEQIDDPDKPESFGIMLAANLIDGFHTAALATANALLNLLVNPEALARVRADRSLVANAFFEGTRLSPPVILTQRYAFEAFEHGDVAIPAGTPIAMVWIAGNRDPEAFPQPDVYDLDRPQRGDVTFGGGAHICPGRNVARMLGEIVLRALTAPDLEIELITDTVEWLPRSTMRQPAEVIVEFRRRAAAAPD